MSFHQKRRSCVLVSSCFITLPLYLIIFLVSSGSLSDFYYTRKPFIAKVDVPSNDIDTNDIKENYDVVTNSHDNPYLNDYGKNVENHDEEYQLEYMNNHVPQVEIINEPVSSIDLSKGELLEDVEKSDVKPNSDNSVKQIFFVQTNTPEGGFIDMNPRQACAIESAANTHPNYNVYVLFPGRTAIDPDANCTKMVNNLISIPNVNFRSIDVNTFAQNTPMEEFFASGKLKKSKHLPTHLADILRILVLYKYGGLYFDLDVVVVKNTEELGENFVVRTNWREFMSGTMQFGGHGIGHKFAEECLKDLAIHFRGYQWAGNGPDLITRNMKRFCDTKNVTLMTTEGCQGMQVLHKKTFLPVAYTMHNIYFSRTYAKKMVAVVENSYTAHIYNHMNHHFKLKKGQISAYTLLAEKYCPVIYGTLDKGDPF